MWEATSCSAHLALVVGFLYALRVVFPCISAWFATIVFVVHAYPAWVAVRVPCNVSSKGDLLTLSTPIAFHCVRGLRLSPQDFRTVRKSSPTHLSGWHMAGCPVLISYHVPCIALCRCYRSCSVRHGTLLTYTTLTPDWLLDAYSHTGGFTHRHGVSWVAQVRGSCRTEITLWSCRVAPADSYAVYVSL